VEIIRRGEAAEGTQEKDNAETQSTLRRAEREKSGSLASLGMIGLGGRSVSDYSTTHELGKLGRLWKTIDFQLDSVPQQE